MTSIHKPSKIGWRLYLDRPEKLGWENTPCSTAARVGYLNGAELRNIGNNYNLA